METITTRRSIPLNPVYAEWVREAIITLSQYQEYGEAMRAHGRGFTPTPGGFSPRDNPTLELHI